MSIGVKIQILYNLLYEQAFKSETPSILRMFHDYIVKKIRYIKIYIAPSELISPHFVLVDPEICRVSIPFLT